MFAEMKLIFKALQVSQFMYKLKPSPSFTATTKKKEEEKKEKICMTVPFAS